MRMPHKPLIAIAITLGLGACTSENSTFLTAATHPAGSFIDEGGFGNATMMNTRAMTQCVGKPKGYIVPEHIVVLNPDPKSPAMETTTPRRGQVRCSGDLNGKYAQVIFEEYVESATELPVSEEGGLAEISQSAGG
ncbi:hypothetical protein [Oceaniglobus trochenteri]|uniref:hypothetical protein n=1 Tax=Oceaniglobus trochenteri TaxID=2763260 RepID=UPI001CFFE02F|nr:hypothetical protein [Oceaniglobus trochenteri]